MNRRTKLLFAAGAVALVLIGILGSLLIFTSSKKLSFKELALAAEIEIRYKVDVAWVQVLDEDSGDCILMGVNIIGSTPDGERFHQQWMTMVDRYASDRCNYFSVVYGYYESETLIPGPFAGWRFWPPFIVSGEG